jgi:hypothetical protein
MCKIMEIIIKDQLVRYLVDKRIINKHQHALISYHSTANLLCINDSGFFSMKTRSCTDAVYTIFSEAFDSVLTPKLLFRFEGYGITVCSSNGLNVSSRIGFSVMYLIIAVLPLVEL